MRNTKIREDDAAQVCAAQDVLWFQIPMKYLTTMRKLQRLNNLVDDLR